MPSPLLNSLTSLSQLGQVIHDKSEKGKAFQTLAVDRIYSKAQPRTVFENLEELAESLKELGQQQPIVVSPDNKGYYVIEQGERRWRAAKLAGLITLDCMVMNREKDGETDRMLRQLTENIQRNEMTLWDLSHAIAALVCQDMTVRQIAKKLGKAESYISTLNAIAKLPKELEVLVKERHLQDAQSVRKLQKLYQEDPRVVSDQIEEWSKNDDFTISRAQVADFIQSLGNSEGESQPQNDDDASGRSEDSDSETVAPKQKEPFDGTLPEGCRTVSPAKLKVEVQWNGNAGWLTRGVVPPEGKLCITLATSEETILVEATDVEVLGVTAR